MLLKELSICNFKNHQKETFHFDKKINCILGRNGCGKTNLLDAIYYTCLTKSYFQSSDQLVMRHGETFFTLNSTITIDEEIFKIKCKVAKDRKKEFLKNDLIYERLSDHVGTFPVVFITPYDNSLILGGSEERRAFLDRLLCQLDSKYLSSLQLYNRLLTQRNAALKQFAERNYFDQNLLSTYSAKMEAPATFIFEKRKKSLEEIIPLFQKLYQQISDNNEVVDILYQSEMNELSFEELTNRNIEKDKILRRTSSGIHKDDLVFMMNDNVIKKFGSQGQQKTFLISLKLAKYMLLKQYKKLKPFLLLDDIFDKLDPKRSSNLLELITQSDFGQIFLSDTQKDRIDAYFGEHHELADIFQIDQLKI